MILAPLYLLTCISLPFGILNFFANWITEVIAANANEDERDDVRATVPADARWAITRIVVPCLFGIALIWLFIALGLRRFTKFVRAKQQGQIKLSLDEFEKDAEMAVEA